MSFDLNVWNGMNDAERLCDFVRVIEEREAMRSRLAEYEKLLAQAGEAFTEGTARIADLEAENAALRKDADATRRRQLYELAGYLSAELPELHGVLGGRLINAVDAYRAKIGDGIRPEELT